MAKPDLAPIGKSAQKKPDTGPASVEKSLKQATADAAKKAYGNGKKKKGKRDAQGRLIMEEVKIVAEK